MKPLYVLDPSQKDTASTFRGGGRVLQLISNYLPDITFVQDVSLVPRNATLIVPYWFPFHTPQIIQTKAVNKILIIFDVIPLKYPAHFPIGIKGIVYKWLNTRFAHDFDQIITISHASKKDIQEYLKIEQSMIKVCHLTVSKSLIENHESIPKIKTPSTFCLYVGDVNWNKNLTYIARSIKMGSTPCVFVGRPFSTNNRRDVLNNKDNASIVEFREFLEIAGDDKRFIFPEHVSDAELKWFYKHALCNLHVSHDEGFGFSYLEAASMSTPSILSNSPIYHEIADKAALFVDLNNDRDLQMKIRQLSEDKSARNMLGKKAYERSLTFSPDKFAREFMAACDL